MEDLCAEVVTPALLAPAYDGAVVSAGQRRALGGQAGQTSRGAQGSLAGQLQQGQVIVHRVPVVSGVGDGPGHGVLPLLALVYHQVVLPQSDHQVLPHAVGRSHHPPGMDQCAATKCLPAKCIVYNDRNLKILVFSLLR